MHRDLGRQPVRGALDDLQFRSRRNQGQRRTHFFRRSKRIARSMGEQHRRPQLTEVLRSRLVRLAWCMERIRKQQQRIRERRIVSGRHGGLPSAIGTTAQIHVSRGEFADRGGCCDYACTIARGLRWKRRTVGPQLAIRQIVAKHPQARIAESFGERAEQWSLAVRSGAVRDRQGVSIG